MWDVGCGCVWGDVGCVGCMECGVCGVVCVCGVGSMRCRVRGE